MRSTTKTTKDFKLLSLSSAITTGTNCVILTIICFTLASSLWIISMPQKRESDRLEKELAASQARLEDAEADLNDLDVSLRALKEDPEYFEVRARDRILGSKPNEAIFSIQR